MIESPRRRKTATTLVGMVVTAGAALLIVSCGSDGNNQPETTSAVRHETSAGNQSAPNDQSAPNNAMISRGQAEQAALATVPDGRVVSAQLKQENGRPVWEVELADAANPDRDIDVDAVTGTVIDPGNDHNNNNDDDDDGPN